MSLVIGGELEQVDGLRCTSWLDDPAIPRLRLGEDARPRTARWIRQIVLHTTKGIPGGRDLRPQVIFPGLGAASANAERVARFWSGDPTPSGAHLVVDHDGDVVCLADLLTDRANHAPPVNDTSIGIELYQGGGAELYLEQLRACVLLVDWLTRRFRVQRQIPGRYRGAPARRLEQGGLDVVGVVGHRDVTSRRGAGDPGDAIFDLLAGAGYERHDLTRSDDRAAWVQRQTDLRLHPPDGVPGPATCDALERAGHPHGLWVYRPGDVVERPAVG